MKERVTPIGIVITPNVVSPRRRPALPIPNSGSSESGELPAHRLKTLYLSACGGGGGGAGCGPVREAPTPTLS